TRQCRRNIDQGGRDARGQENPDTVLVPPSLAQRSGERHGSHEGCEARDVWAASVGEGEVERMAACKLDERTMQRPALRLAEYPRRRTKLLHRLPDVVGPCPGGQGWSEGNSHRIGHSLGDLRQEPPTRMAEDASPDTVQVHRNDRRGPTLDDPLQTTA